MDVKLAEHRAGIVQELVRVNHQMMGLIGPTVENIGVTNQPSNSVG